MSAKIDWQNIERAEPLIATVANMRECELQGVPGVFMLDANGDEWSATPGDYFMRGEEEVFETNGQPNILARRRTLLVHPLTNEVI